MTEEVLSMLKEVLRGERTDAKAIEALEDVLELCPSNGTSERMALAGAIASNLLFNNPAYANQEGESARRWKNYKCSNPAELPQGELFIAASLLYDREDYKEAAELFKRFLNQCADENSDEFFRASLLTAYCYEALARKDNNPRHVDSGLKALDGLSKRLKPDERTVGERRAEILHAQGHLHIARCLLSSATGKSDRQQGIRCLSEASKANPAYMSCYTSVYSEVGDYLSTIQVSLDEVDKETYRDVLDQEGADTVEMEILFYIAHAYSCIGEYNKALQCFATFSDRMKNRERHEAHAHGQLFMLKTHLKRSMLEDLTSPQIGDLINRLREISFPSRSSKSVSDEAKRYEDVLDFLRCLVEHREKGNESLALDDLYLESLQLIGKLAETVKEVVAQPIVLVVSDTPGVRENRSDIFQDLNTFDWIITECEPSVELLSRRIYQDIVFVIDKEKGICPRIVHAFEPEKFIIALSEKDDEDPMDGVYVSANPAYLKQVLAIGTAFSLCKRFMIQNRYIFALAPCEDSPALKYQKPRLAFEQYL